MRLFLLGEKLISQAVFRDHFKGYFQSSHLDMILPRIILDKNYTLNFWALKKLNQWECSA